jgi:hypothetical protein
VTKLLDQLFGREKTKDAQQPSTPADVVAPDVLLETIKGTPIFQQLGEQVSEALVKRRRERAEKIEEFDDKYRRDRRQQFLDAAYAILPRWESQHSADMYSDEWLTRERAKIKRKEEAAVEYAKTDGERIIEYELAFLRHPVAPAPDPLLVQPAKARQELVKELRRLPDPRVDSLANTADGWRQWWMVDAPPVFRQSLAKGKAMADIGAATRRAREMLDEPEPGPEADLLRAELNTRMEALRREVAVEPGQPTVTAFTRDMQVMRW